MNVTLLDAILFLGVLLLTFLSRAWPRWYMREPSLSDAVTHLAMVKAIRENHHRVPDIVPRWVPKQRLLYPTFYHWLLSYLTPTALRQFERISGALLDTVHNALTMVAAYWLLSAQELPAAQVARGAVLAGLLFAVSPRLIRPEERAFFLNPRPFGALFVSIAFLGTLWFLWTEAWIVLTLAIIAFGITSISHKFAFQAIVFLSLMLSVLVGSAWFLVALAGGLLGAVLVTRGHALQIWRSHIGYSRLYRRHIAPRSPRIKDTAWTILRNAIEAKRRGGNWKREVIRLVFNTEVDWFAQAVWLLPVCYFVAVMAFTPLKAPAQVLHLGLWVVGATLIGLITTLQPLRFLGQSSRYLEYAVLPGSIFLAYVAVGLPDLASSRLIVWVVLILCAGTVILYYLVTLIVYKRTGLDELAKALNWLAEQPSQVVLCSPIHGLPSAVWTQTNHTVVGWIGQMNDQTSASWLEDYLALCPNQHLVLPYDLNPIIQRYGVDLVFCNPGVNHNLQNFSLAYENGGYTLYRVKHASSDKSQRGEEHSD